MKRDSRRRATRNTRRREGSRRRRGPWRALLIACLVVGLAGVGAAGGLVWWLTRDLPRFDALFDYEPRESTRVWAGDTLVATFADERRTVVPPEDIPEVLKRAILAAEDANFYAHEGLDYVGIARAFWKNLRSGQTRQGASTITQQVVKTFLLTPDRTYERKIKEIVLARRLERNLTKDEILYLYLNQIYFGHGRYGVEEAARHYFGKGVRDVDLGEAAMLAGLPQSPARLSPIRHPERAKTRQRYVLGRMLENGWITQAEYDREIDAPILVAERPEPMGGSWYVEEVRRRLVERYGDEMVLAGGLEVHVGMDPELQRAAEEALREGLRAYEKRRASRRGQAPAEEPDVEGALVAIDPQTRRVRALVGGWDFARSKFLRATQARRQPGSAFKPFVFGAALESGRWTAASRVVDAPETFRDPWTGEKWTPRNYERGSFEGTMTLRTAVARSKNTVAVRLISELGVESVIDFAQRAGIQSELPHNLTLSLGTGEVTPMEMANAFATLAAGGLAGEPVLIERVEDRHGEILEEARPRLRPAISPAIAYVLTELLQAVVEDGTGRAARVLGRPTAAKTGTTSDGRDAWMVGYTPDLVAVSWVGFDDQRPLGPGETGGRTALPGWLGLMQAGHEGLPPRDFPVPPGVERVAIDRETGLLAAEGAGPEASVEAAFVAGTAPTERAVLPGRSTSDLELDLFLGGSGGAP